MSMPTIDLAIVGAGPAGLAAASAAVRSASTSTTTSAREAPRILIIDAADQPGGQFWRHRTETAVTDDGHLHHDWAAYRTLCADFEAGRDAGVLGYRPATSVWMVTASPDGFDLHFTPSHGPGRSADPIIRARRLLIATGGYDRQIPIPGWDLPGVMAAGGIQGFAKQNGMLPGRRFLIAGTGPFLLPVAQTVTQLRGEVAAVLESSRLTGWLPHAHRAAGVPGKALEGAGYAWSLLRHRIPYRTRTVVTEILGTDRAEAVHTARIDRLGRVIPGTERTIEGIDTVGLGWGFTPQLDLPVSLGAATRVDADGSLVAAVDAQQRSSVPGLFLAGEVTGVGGAVLAVAEGRVAGAAAIAEVVGRLDAAATSRDCHADTDPSLRSTIARHRAFARAMHLAHPVPAGWADRLGEETIVCRCEEVTAEEITGARTSLAAEDARAQKSMTRAGMGWCQGRECGFAVACLAARGGGAADGGGSVDDASGVGGAGASGTEIAASLAQTMKRPIAHPVPLSTFGEL